MGVVCGRLTRREEECSVGGGFRAEIESGARATQGVVSNREMCSRRTASHCCGDRIRDSTTIRTCARSIELSNVLRLHALPAVQILAAELGAGEPIGLGSSNVMTGFHSPHPLYSLHSLSTLSHYARTHALSFPSLPLVSTKMSLLAMPLPTARWLHSLFSVQPPKVSLAAPRYTLGTRSRLYITLVDTHTHTLCSLCNHRSVPLH